MRFRRPRAATIIAFAALFAMLGGSAVAAKKITSKDIRNGTIKTRDLSKSAKRALEGERGPQGAPGPRGPVGPQGPAGPSVAGQSTLVKSSRVAFGDEVAQLAIATCPAGHRVIGGGGVSISDEQLAVTSPSDDRTSWGVIGVDLNFDGGEYVEAYAICAPTGRAVLATRRSARRAAARRHFTRIAARFDGTRR